MAQALVAVVLCLSLVMPVFAAAPPAKSTVAQTKTAKYPWESLTPAQQQVLAPLKEDWQELDTLRRGKWIKVADRYPSMKPEQQERLQKRMRDWALLTPEQRAVAREKYKTLKKLPPEKREHVKSQWQRYQQSLVPPADSGSPNAAPATAQ